jgi:hypothetical protein
MTFYYHTCIFSSFQRCNEMCNDTKICWVGGGASQIYELDRFIQNSHEIYYFMGSFFLHMDVVHHTCFKHMTSMCKKHEWMIFTWFSLSNSEKGSLWYADVSISSSFICFKIFENVSKYRTIRHFKPSDNDSLEMI